MSTPLLTSIQNGIPRRFNFLYWTLNSLFITSLIVFFLNSGAFAAGPPEMVFEGEVEIIHIDEFEKGKSRFVYFLFDSENNERVELSFANKPPRLLKPGKRIIAHGRSENGKLKVSEIIAGVNGDSSATEDESMVAEAGTGIHHTIVMIVNMPNSLAETDPLNLHFDASEISKAAAEMFSDSNSVNAIYDEASFGQLTFPGDMGNDVVLVEIPYVPVNYVNDSQNCNYYTIASQADQAATAAGVNLGAYHNKMYLVPPGSISDCHWLALGQVGSYGSSLVRLSWSTRNDSVAYAHELGHNLGWHHAATDPDNDGNLNVEYGDTSSIMGYCCTVKKFNAVNVDQIGWYDSASSPDLLGSVINVTSTGTFQLAPLGSNPADVNYDPQILKIDKPDTNENYYLSFRKKVGLDASLSTSYTTGVSIHHATENGIWSYLIDVLDSGSGNQFVDSVNGITITQMSNTVDSVTVNISFGGVAPTASFTHSTSGLTANFTDTSNDVGGTIVSWLWNFGDGNTSTLQNPSHTYASANTYPVSLTVTDNDGETDATSQNVTVTVPDTTPPTITASADVVVEATGVNTSVSLVPPTVSDDTDPSPSVSADNLGPYPIGTTTVTWTATDASGNSATDTQDVTVRDTTAPSEPANLAATKKKVKGSQSIKVTWGASNDNGSGVDYYTVSRNGVSQGNTTSTSFVDPVVEDGAVYSVTATDMMGNTSDASTVTYGDGGSGGGGSGGGGSFCDTHPGHKRCQ